MCAGKWSRPVELYCPGDAETLHRNTNVRASVSVLENKLWRHTGIRYEERATKDHTDIFCSQFGSYEMLGNDRTV